jgi:hypothetical protein
MKIIIKSSSKEDWFNELEGHVFSAIKEDEKNYFIKIKNEILPISKSKASKCEKIEIEDENLLRQLDFIAEQNNITTEELINIMFKTYANKKEKQ